jgi:hypothetical protein
MNYLSIVDSLLAGCSGFGREEDTGFCGCHDGQARLGLPPFSSSPARSGTLLIGRIWQDLGTRQQDGMHKAHVQIWRTRRIGRPRSKRPYPVLLSARTSKNNPSQFRSHSVLSHLTHRPEAGCLCSANAMCRACRLRQSAVEFRGKYISHCQQAARDSTGWI